MNAVEMIQNLLLRSGAGWVLWVLCGLSLVTAVVAVERWLFYRTVDLDLRAMAGRLDAELGQGHVAEAIAELGRSRSIAASIAAAGLRLAARGPEAVEKAMQSAIALERERLEVRLTFLGTVGNNAPFIGLFGTVIGIIHAFSDTRRPGMARRRRRSPRPRSCRASPMRWWRRRSASSWRCRPSRHITTCRGGWRRCYRAARC